MKACGFCRLPLTRRDKEQPWAYRKRIYCDLKCARGVNRKLTEIEVRIIRGDKSCTHEELAHLFGVSASSIANIRKRKTWAWLED